MADTEWRNDWDCCIPQMHWKRANFAVVQVLGWMMEVLMFYLLAFRWQSFGKAAENKDG